MPAGGWVAPEADDAGVVDHLDDDHHIAGRLHDLVVVVVEHVQHRRTTGRAVADDAAFAQGTHLRAAEIAELPHAGGHGGPPALRRIGDLAGRRIDDPRGANLAAHHSELRSRVEPEGVVTSRIVAFFRLLGRVVVGGQPGLVLGDRLGRLLRRQHQLGRPGRALEGGDRGVRPQPLQVRVAELGARRVVGGRGRPLGLGQTCRGRAEGEGEAARGGGASDEGHFNGSLRKFPYISSSTNSTHLNCCNCASSPTRR